MSIVNFTYVAATPTPGKSATAGSTLQACKTRNTIALAGAFLRLS